MVGKHGRGTRWKGTAGDHKGPPRAAPPPSPLRVVMGFFSGGCVVGDVKRCPQISTHHLSRGSYSSGRTSTYLRNQATIETAFWVLIPEIGMRGKNAARRRNIPCGRAF